MGVIKRQTIKGSIYSYLGVAVGFLTTVIIVPKVITADQFGLTNILAAISALYAQFSTLGFTSVTSRLFSYFRDNEKQHNGFVFLTISIGIIGFLLAIISFFILKPYIIESNQKDSPLLVQYIWFLVPLIFFRLFFLLLDTYNKMLFDATTGTLLTDLVYRIGNLLLLAVLYLGWINFSQYILGYVLVLCFPSIYLAGLLIYRKQFNLKPQFDFLTRPMRKEMINLSLFGLIAGLSSVALGSIDKIILNQYYNLSLTGAYSISFFFGTVILIPNRAVGKISSTVIADAWKDNNIAIIDDIYYKSSINQLFAGMLLFLLLVCNLHNIFQILTKEYAGGEWVITIISFANLIVMSTGVSVQILATSHKYKIQTYSLGILLILTIIFNFIFIPSMGMNGAALATLFALTISSIVRVFYLKIKMRLFPYKKNHLQCILIGIAVFLLNKILPVIDNIFIDLFIRSSLISGVFVFGCFFNKVSNEVNTFILNILKSFTLVLRKPHNNEE